MNEKKKKKINFFFFVKKLKILKKNSKILKFKI